MRYAIIKNDIVDNVMEIEPGSDWVPDEDAILIPSDIAGPGWSYSDGVFQAPPPAPEPVPEKIMLWQARAILDMTGSLAAANAAVAASKNPALKAVWEYGNEISRSSGVIDDLGAGIGLTKDQIDDLFRNAAALSA